MFFEEASIEVYTVKSVKPPVFSVHFQNYICIKDYVSLLNECSLVTKSGTTIIVPLLVYRPFPVLNCMAAPEIV